MMRVVGELFRERRLCVAAMLFVAAAVGFQSETLASCGDYLAPSAGAVHGTTDNEVWLSTGHTYARGRHGHDYPAESLPRSGCENGQCRALPLSSLPDPPPRTISSKHWLGGFAALCIAGKRVHSSWAFPVDCLFVEKPFLGIDPPPPRQPFFFA